MLNQTTYRLYLRTEINQTGLANGPAIDAAIAAIAAANALLFTTGNPIDKQD
jgi:hypothetical protein